MLIQTKKHIKNIKLNWKITLNVK